MYVHVQSRHGASTQHLVLTSTGTGTGTGTCTCSRSHTTNSPEISKGLKLC